MAKKQEVLLIAKRIRAARDRLLELFDETTDSNEQDQIADQLKDLDDQVMRLISISIDDSTKEYKQATEALGKANTKIGQAIKDQQKVADAISAVAQAIGLIAQIRPA
jgi:hypothetical protein